MESTELAKMVHQAKGNQEVLQLLIEKFQPLINSYCRKLFFLELDDAKQELYLVVIESVRNIPYCKTDGQCITYISNAIKFKYCFLCKKNLARERIENSYAECEEETYIEKFTDIEFQYDLNNALVQLPEKQQVIWGYVLADYSDSQIAEVMGMSRQYINRIRKQVGKIIFLFYEDKESGVNV